MYIRVQTSRAFGESVDPFEGTLTGSLLGNAEIFLFLNDRLGGGRHRVTYRTEEPPAGIELYPYERVATQVFKLMDGPYNIAAGAKGKWIRFDVDVGWLFWLRVVNSRPELKLAMETRATFGEILRHLKQPGLATISLELSTRLESGEFCKKTKLNTRGYPCTLGVPTQSVDQKGYPLAQAHCTPFAQSCSLFVWFAPASE
jgi:hypothetical protein